MNHQTTERCYSEYTEICNISRETEKKLDANESLNPDSCSSVWSIVINIFNNNFQSESSDIIQMLHNVCPICQSDMIDFLTTCFPLLVLTTGPGNLPPVWIWTAETGLFDSTANEKPNPLTLGAPNPDPYTSTRGICRVWLDPLVTISCSVVQVSLSIVAFR